MKLFLNPLSAWFGITSTILFWVKSYLLNRSFYVITEGSIIPDFQLNSPTILSYKKCHFSPVNSTRYLGIIFSLDFFLLTTAL